MIECGRVVLLLLLGEPAVVVRPKRWSAEQPTQLSWDCGCLATEVVPVERYMVRSCERHAAAFDVTK